MLQPDHRGNLLENLRPPEGYTLDYAIGTTYSLDLLALLTAPLAFTLFDWEDEDGRLTKNPQALLAATKRNAHRITIFSQAGQIALPRKNEPLFHYLEKMVFEVVPPNPRGVFHPKVWVLRFTSAGCPVRYRLLCLSRNLTFDRSWDTVLALDGTLKNRRRPFAANKSLGKFLLALPQLAVRRVPKDIAGRIRAMGRELTKVEFTPPEGFQSVAFHTPGIKGSSSWPFDYQTNRLLVISPFLSIGCLNRLNEGRQNDVLISQPAALQALSKEVLQGFGGVYSLNPSANPEPREDEDTAVQADALTAGLHAKLYVAEQGKHVIIWTGSANATDAAFQRNVEFLTEMVGVKSRHGIDELLRKSKDRDQMLLGNLLEEFDLDSRFEKPDPDLQRLERKIQEAKVMIAGRCLEAVVAHTAQREWFKVRLTATTSKPERLPGGLRVSCWPISKPEAGAKPYMSTGNTAATFERIHLLDLTQFYAFEIIARIGRKSLRQRFVLNLPLRNAPSDRQDSMLKAMLNNKEDVMRLLLLLLFDETLPAQESDVLSAVLPSRKGDWGHGQQPLFEALMRALDQDPTRIEDVAHIIEDLRKSTEGRAMLPDGLDRIWEPILEAKRGMQR
jgi:hypothetical protein